MGKSAHGSGFLRFEDFRVCGLSIRASGFEASKVLAFVALQVSGFSNFRVQGSTLGVFGFRTSGLEGPLVFGLGLGFPKFG